MIYLDTETCGLHGIITLIQWAEDDGPIHLFNPWFEPVEETLELLYRFCDSEICGFNLAFDWFHVNKLGNIWLNLQMRDPDTTPILNVPLITKLEAPSRDGFCFKPRAACDIMLHARKGEYQSTMDRKDIRIRRVPTQLAFPLAEELDKIIPMKDIYFARKKDKKQRWQVFNIVEEDGSIDPNLKDVVLKFAPSSALKTLAADALNIEMDKVLRFGDIEPSRSPDDKSFGWVPVSTLMPEETAKWPHFIEHHVEHWAFNKPARQYASDDIVYTRDLHKHFGSPAPGDHDSELACCVGAVRWKGFRVDLDGIRVLRDEAARVAKSAPRAPAQVRAYILKHMNATEALALRKDTKEVTLLSIAGWENHPAAKAAQEVLDARHAKKEIEIYDKLLLAGRFHASFKVIGTKSSRMAGTDGLNAQGINNSKKVRSRFPLAWENQILSGGDFSSFETVLAAADFQDDKLTDLIKSGKKLQGLIGEEVFNRSYDDVLASDGTEDDVYTDSKRCLYSWLYGGDANTWEHRIGIDHEIGQKALDSLGKRFPGIARARKEIEEKFCSMSQPGGLGSEVVWKDPSEYIESMFGFRRYFTLENMICKTLYDLAQRPPKSFQRIRGRVQRRPDKVQTACGALQSALYGCAFGIQSANLRAAANHRIQSSGGQICKHLQRAIWDLQPAGCHPWKVMPLNVHDELGVPHEPGLEGVIADIVGTIIESYRARVPLIKIDWESGLLTWKGK